MRLKEIRCCVVCSTHKLPPRLRRFGPMLLQAGEFIIKSTSSRKTCSSKCSMQYRESPETVECYKKRRKDRIIQRKQSQKKRRRTATRT